MLKSIGAEDLLRIVSALAASFLVMLALDYLFFWRTGKFLVTIPELLISLLVFFVLTEGTRYYRRLFRVVKHFFNRSPDSVRVMIVGAGATGAMVIREMKRKPEMQLTPVCVIDDNPKKLHTQLNGVPVVGGRSEIPAMAKKYGVGRILVAMPSAAGKDISEICSICTRTRVRVQIISGLRQMIAGDTVMHQMRDVDVNDLLGRAPIQINAKEVFDYIEGKSILVTGGGGSIGSELCRQIAAHNPAQLVIFDIYENNAYEIEQELRRAYPNLNLQVLIGSVRDEVRVDAVFAECKPQIVFHAAAHKHVPLMEKSPGEAVKNNVFGTYNVAAAADKYEVERFVMISTDKAVNPTNVMGATKRICEMIVQQFNTKSKNTDYVAVRFGNVLGSNGSVIPLFKRQIASGGPVSVTHKDIIRYFMTIPEAVSLVLQAGAYAQGGEIFVLDMGEPVKILTLAENLIRLSGHVPYTEIPIVFTGLRPGEKLYEELLMQEEGMKSTANHKIFIGNPISFDVELLEKTLVELKDAATNDTTNVRRLIKLLVPTYQQKDEHA